MKSILSASVLLFSFNALATDEVHLFPKAYVEQMNTILKRDRLTSKGFNAVLNLTCNGHDAKFEPKQIVKIIPPQPPYGLELAEANSIQKKYVDKAREFVKKVFFSMAQDNSSISYYPGDAPLILKSPNDVLNSLREARSAVPPYLNAALLKLNAEDNTTYVFPNTAAKEIFGQVYNAHSPRTEMDSTAIASMYLVHSEGPATLFQYADLMIIERNFTFPEDKIRDGYSAWDRYVGKNTESLESIQDDGTIVFDLTLKMKEFCEHARPKVDVISR